MATRARRVDANHAAIVAALRARGWYVRSTAGVGSGFPDILIVKHGVMRQAEIKDGAKVPSARKLTTDEALYHWELQQAGCPVLILETIADVERLCP